MNQSRDVVKAHDASGAVLARLGVMGEGLRTQGVFHAQCFGPVERFREEYVETRDALARLESDGFARLVARKRIGLLKSKLVAIPMEEKWADEARNVVTTVGKNDMEDKYFAGSAYTASIRMGLKGTGTAVIGDAQGAHAGWLEQGLANAPTYTGNRPTPSFAAASGGVKATSAAVSFSITSTGTVFGAFINNGGSATKDDTTGVLFSAGDFSGGSKAVVNGDTLTITYSLTLT